MAVEESSTYSCKEILSLIGHVTKVLLLVVVVVIGSSRPISRNSRRGGTMRLKVKWGNKNNEVSGSADKIKLLARKAPATATGVKTHASGASSYLMVSLSTLYNNKDFIALL